MAIPEGYEVDKYGGVVKKVEEQAPAASTPKVRWWNKVKDGIGEALGKAFVDR